MNKKLRRFDVFALVIGSIIGWGSFFLPGKKFLAYSGIINTTIGLILGGVLISFIQKSYHIMLEKQNREEGGEFTYVYNNLGKRHGFIVGWSLSLCYLSMIPLNASAFVLLFKSVFGDIFSIGYMYNIAGYDIFITDVILMSFIIILFAYINIKGLKFSSFIQNIMSFLLVLIVVLLLVFVTLKSDLVSFNNNYIFNKKLEFNQIFSVVAIVPFLFVGFDVVPQLTKDLTFKPHNATILTIITIFIGTLIYASLNVIAGMSFSPSEVINTNWAVADSILLKLGKFGFSFMLVALLAAIIGGINGFMIASSKLIASLSNYKILNKKYTKLNNKNVYVNAIIFVSMISLIAPWIGREVIIYIVDMASLLATIAYGYVCYLGILNSKKIIDKILTIAGLIICVVFSYLLLSPFSVARLSDGSLIFLVLWTILGFIFYNFSYRNNSK